MIYLEMKGFPVVIMFLAGVRIIEAQTTMENVKAIWNRYAQVTGPGDSTYYGKYPGGGACALDPPSPLNKQPGWIMVAAGKYDYQKSLGCGMCLEITANGEQTSPATGGPTPMKGTYKAYIVDLCGGCNQAGFDFYIPGFGKYKTSVKAIPCPTVPGQQGNIQFRFTGSNPWAIKVQVRNSKVVTVGMEIEHNGKWVCMKRTSDNYFAINGLGELKFPKKFRVTSISGEQLESTAPAIKNNENIPSTIQYSGFKPDSNPQNIKCFGQDGKTEQPIGPNTNAESPKPTPVSTLQPPGSQFTPSKPAGATGPTPGPTTGSPQSTTAGTLQPPGSQAPPSPPSKPAGENKNFCKGKATGLYADPNDCGNFYQCADGITYWKHCPNGLYFNPKIDVCDFPANVDCTARFVQVLKKSKLIQEN